LPLALGSALASVVLGMLLAAPGCLNPRPEEDPSVDSSEGIEPGGVKPSTPIRESCDDNPYLTGCDVPDQDDNGADPEPANGGALPGAPEAPADVGVADAGAADAGAPADATDARAP
jgi:hypothetical protein